MTVIEKLKQVSGRDDWKVIEGPDSGHGVDYWFENGDGKVVYGNDDQGQVILQDADDVTLFEGTLDEV